MKVTALGVFALTGFLIFVACLIFIHRQYRKEEAQKKYNNPDLGWGIGFGPQ